LFFSEPLATAQTTGNSRSTLMPETCSAFRARSSPSTPEVFFRGDLGHGRHVVKQAGDVVEQGQQTGTGPNMTY